MPKGKKCKSKIYVFTDGATDDLQALFYLNKHRKIDGIIVETGVPDKENVIRNIILLRALYLDPHIPIYGGNLKFLNKAPPDWKLDAKYSQYVLEQIYVQKYGEKEYYNPCEPLPSYKCLDFTNATIFSQGKATTINKILREFNIRRLNPMLGGDTGDPMMPLEFNASCDVPAFLKVKKYLKRRPSIGSLYTLQDITPEKVQAADAFCQSYPVLIDIIRPSSREGWQYWDLTMVMNFVPPLN
jgi:hypothetical protein